MDEDVHVRKVCALNGEMCVIWGYVSYIGVCVLYGGM